MLVLFLRAVFRGADDPDDSGEGAYLHGRYSKLLLQRATSLDG